MSAKPKHADSTEALLAEWLASVSHKPYEFVLGAFPWGEPGTPLANQEGPDEWQREHLIEIGEELAAGKTVQEAIASGHGIGKSCDAAWLILWALSTFEDTRGVVTANTENQLATKTWAELAKWHRMLICRHWFKFNATSIHSVEKGHEKTWRVDAIAWSINNTEAFAGLHNAGKRVFALYDEASAIPDPIWEVTEGALTDADTEIIWSVRGNPTRNAGKFRDCFGRNKHRWRTRQIDSRTVRITNKEQIAKWVADYGEDSDFVRIRVRGVFPRAGSLQFQPSDTVHEAMKRQPSEELVILKNEPLVIGVDVARWADAESVICPRRGRDAKTIPWRCVREVDTMTLASLVIEMSQQNGGHRAIFVDAGGMGIGVIDRLRQLRVPNVFGVNFGGKPYGWKFEDESVLVSNRATEMACGRREWLKNGGCIPNDQTLEAQLVDREYGFHPSSNAIVLESKEHMKTVRKIDSPDRADALDLTFAMPVLPASFEQEQEAQFYDTSWSPFDKS